ncbi:hypothetical protein ACS0TY_006012 [Phlomoides rotata]
MIHFQEGQSNGGITPEKKEFSSKNMNKNAAETQGSLNSGSRLSTGSYDNGDNARGSCSEKTDSANVNQRKIPNYLRASTGSCHDICKYGRRHAFEEKPKIPLRKRFTKPSLNEDTFIEILVSSEQKKENVDSKKHSPKPSPDAHSRRPNASSSGKTRSPNSPTKKPPSPETPEVVMRETLLPQDSIDDKMSSSDQKTFDQMLKHPSSVKSKPVKVKSSDGVHGMGRRDGDVQTGGKVRASASAKKAAAAPLAPKRSLSKTTSNKARQSGRVKSSSPGKDQHTSNNKVSEKTLHVIKIGTGNNPLESAPENNVIPALESPSSPISLSQVNPSMTDEVNGTDEFADNKSMIMETKNTESESTLDCHVTPALPSPSSLKSSSHRRSPSSSSLSSKSLSHRRSPSSSSLPSKSSSHRRSPSSSSLPSKFSSHRRSPSSSSSSSSKSSSHSRSPSMSSLEEDEEIKNIAKETNKLVSGKRTTVKISKATQPPKGNLNKNPRKIKVVSSDDKHNRPVKLKFRSGKVVDLHQDNNNNNNIPRRLKFRRMRVDGNKPEISVSHSKKSLEIGNIHSVKENSKTLRKSRVVVSEYKRRSPLRLSGSEKGSSLQADSNVPLRLRFRRGRIMGADEGKGDSKRNIRNGGVEGANLKVKLKHQDLKGKKGGQCLFNNVIEETATKLAESRKSKVKALVGAFETVISLHSPRA